MMSPNFPDAPRTIPRPRSFACPRLRQLITHVARRKGPTQCSPI